MNNELKKSYRQAIDQPMFPYGASINAGVRLFKIFKTGNWHLRPDTLFFPRPEGGEGMRLIWDLISPYAEEPDRIPASTDAFDVWVNDLIENTANAYNYEPPYPLGMAQKTVNLFLKDLWAWDKLTDKQEGCLHAPIDRKVFERFSMQPKSWEAWTLVKYHDAQGLADLRSDYMTLQDSLRKKANKISRPALIITPIMAEQMIWGGVPREFEDSIPGGSKALNII